MEKESGCATSARVEKKLKTRNTNFLNKQATVYGSFAQMLQVL
jgi:hypothetical protein